jgi:hypothetical protein
LGKRRTTRHALLGGIYAATEAPLSPAQLSTSEFCQFIQSDGGYRICRASREGVTAVTGNTGPAICPRHARQPVAVPPRLSGHDAQAEVFGERIEIAVVVQQGEFALDASGGNYRIDGLANGHTARSQLPEIPGGLNRDFPSAELDDYQGGQHFPRLVEVALAGEALQDLSENQIADGQRLIA